MGRPPGDKDEVAGGRTDLAVSEQKRSLTGRDVERLVGIRVDVKGGAG